MGIKQKIILSSFVVILGILGYFSHTTQSYAADASMDISPQTGTYQTGQVFEARVMLDGGGVQFNAAKATVSISSSLQVESVTMGDCDFAFVKTPVQTDPSFAGVILGNSTTSCTVYTLQLRAVKPGAGSVTLISGSIKAYKGAVEILSMTKNSVYTITGSTVQPSTTPAPVMPPFTDQQGVKLYTLVTNIIIPPDIPTDSIIVTLDPSLSTQRQLLGNSFGFHNPVVFDRVPEGVHTLETRSGTQLLSRQIITVSGPVGTLVFGVSQTQKPAQWIWYVIAALGLVCVMGGMIFLIKFFLRKKSSSVNKNQQQHN